MIYNGFGYYCDSHQELKIKGIKIGLKYRHIGHSLLYLYTSYKLLVSLLLHACVVHKLY